MENSRNGGGNGERIFSLSFPIFQFSTRKKTLLKSRARPSELIIEIRCIRNERRLKGAGARREALGGRRALQPTPRVMNGDSIGCADCMNESYTESFSSTLSNAKDKHERALININLTRPTSWKERKKDREQALWRQLEAAGFVNHCSQRSVAVQWHK